MKPFLIALLTLLPLTAQTLKQSIDLTASQTLTKFGLTPDQLAITVIDLKDPSHPVAYHGAQTFYPASVVKLFYLVAAHAAIESGTLHETPEFDRALHDMIVSSSNDATQLIFSTLTGTTGGPELTEAELKPWLAKREVINDYFKSIGYKDINVNQPTFAEDPYGRERQSRGPDWENNNRLTTDSVARLWMSIVTRKAVTSNRSEQMLTLLKRDPFASNSKDEQATDFGGRALPADSQYWSKAGWTETVRHDSAFVQLPNGAQYICVAFTKGVSTNTEILPFLHAHIAAYFLQPPKVN